MNFLQRLHLPLCFFLMILAGLAGCNTDTGKSTTGGTVSDADGNSYHTIEIGDQVWMKENLKTTRFNDGTPLPQVTGYEEWAGLDKPAYCWYNNDTLNGETYGALYNWYVVENGNICPEGWHVPTDEEWNTLELHVKEQGPAGNALKEAGTDHWRNPNAGASNTSGFKALPGGYRSYNGTFNLQRAYGYWWSSSESDWWSGNESRPDIVFHRDLRYDDAGINRYVSEKTNGFSIRCIQDQ